MELTSNLDHNVVPIDKSIENEEQNQQLPHQGEAKWCWLI